MEDGPSHRTEDGRYSRCHGHSFAVGSTSGDGGNGDGGNGDDDDDYAVIRNHSPLAR